MPTEANAPGVFIDETPTLPGIDLSVPEPAAALASSDTAVKASPMPAGRAPAGPLARVAGPYRHLVINGANLWVASADAARAIVRVDRACVENGCTFDNIVASMPVRSMVPYGAGVAIATGSSLVMLTQSTRLERVAPAVALARSGADLVYATETTTELAFVGSGATAPLLATDPTSSAFKPFGASLVAGGCDATLWAFQVFKKATDGGELANYVLTRTGVGATAAGIPVVPPAFALAADTTHAYVGNADGQGVTRWAPGESVTTIVPGRSAWSLAMTDDHVYFDDHGGLGAKQSVGLFRVKKSQ